jgi:hypothetical protein
MRKILLAFSVALLAAAIVAPPASATFLLPADEYSASVVDRSGLFSEAGDGDPYLEPEGLGDPIDEGDEQRSIVKVDAINTGNKVVEGSTGLKTVVEDGGSASYPSGLLTGMLYDLQIQRIVNQNTGAVGGPIVVPPVGSTDPYTLEKTRAGRYLSAGGTDGTWTDTVGAPGDLVSDLTPSGVSYGGLLVIYEDPAINLSPPQPMSFAGDGVGAIGPWDWREPGDLSGASPHPGAAAMGVPGVLTNADYFPTLSDVPGSNVGVADSGTATPWLVAVFADLADIPAHGIWPANPFGVAQGTYVRESEFVVFSDASAGFDGIGFANVIGGTAAGKFALGNFDIISGGTRWLADLRVEFEGESIGILYDGWQVDSDDPTMFGIIPEPTTMTLLGLALVGLPGVLHRSKKK